MHVNVVKVSEPDRSCRGSRVVRVNFGHSHHSIRDLAERLAVQKYGWKIVSPLQQQQRESGEKKKSKDDFVDLVWSGRNDWDVVCTSLLPGQRTNTFPGMQAVVDKIVLARNLNFMKVRCRAGGSKSIRSWTRNSRV